MARVAPWTQSFRKKKQQAVKRAVKAHEMLADGSPIAQSRKGHE